MHNKRYIIFCLLLFPAIVWGQCDTIRSFPWQDNLENSTGVACWEVGDLDGDGDTWDWYDDPQEATNRLFASLSATNTDNLLGSPWFALPANAKRITLRYDAMGGNETYYKDNYSIYVSDSDSFDENVPIKTSGVNNTFESSTLDLTPWKGQTIHFAIRHYNNFGISDGSFYLAFDNFSIEVECDTASKTSAILAINQYLWHSTTIYHDTTLYDTTQHSKMCNDTLFVYNISVQIVDTINLSDTMLTVCDSAEYRLIYYYSDTSFVDTSINDTGSVEIQTVSITIANGLKYYDRKTLTVFPQYRWRDGSRITKDTTISDTVHLSTCSDSIYQTIITFIPDTVRLGDTTIYACDTAFLRNKYFINDVIGVDTSRNDTGSVVIQHVSIAIYHSFENFDSVYIDTCKYYKWQGMTIVLPGNYVAQYTTKDPAHCDSIYRINLQLPLLNYDTVWHVTNDTLCGVLRWQKRNIMHDTTLSDSILIGDTVYITTTNYTILPTKIVDRDSTINGIRFEVYVSNTGEVYQQSDDIPEVQGDCDSVILVHLNVLCGATTGPTVDTVACSMFSWHGTTYRYIENGKKDYRIEDTITNHCGEDSIRQVHVYLRPSYFYTDTVTERQHRAISWHGRVLNRSGKYQKKYQTTWGCDSIYEIRIRFVDPNCATTYHYEDTMACDSLLYKNTMYTCDTSLSTKLVNVEGCDSMYITRIKIKHSYNNNIDTSACELIRWNHHDYTRDTILQLFSGYTTYGCDSTETMTFEFGKISNIRDTVVGCDRYKYRNIIYLQTDDDVFNSTNDSTGCDSTIYVHIIIKYSSRRDNQINSCDSARVYDSLFLASTTLKTKDTAANGCDSTTYLHINIYRPENHDTFITACDFYTYNHDTTFYQSEDYSDTFGVTNHGCHKIENIHLTLYYSDTIKIDSLICGNEMTWYANRFTHDTIARFVHTNRHHCDSTEILNLKIRKNSQYERSIIACDSYRWFDSTYCSTTDAIRHVKNQAGCDSTVTMHLTVYHNDTIDTIIRGCKYLQWHDSTYYSNTIDTFFFNIHTCHYAEILHLSLGADTATHYKVSACDSMTWGNTLLHNDTTIVQRLHTIYGCDSITTTTVNIFHATHSHVTISDCDSHTWHGTTYYASTNTPTYTRSNMHGCDSIISLNLTIYNSGEYADTLIGCDSIVYNNTTYTSNQRLVLPRHLNTHGCDSIPVVQLILYHGGDTIYYSAISCNQYTWHNNTYTTDTIATIDSTDNYNCMHSIQLKLNLHYSDITHQHITSCDSMHWRDSTYHATTTIQHDTTNHYGCDSTSLLHLLINYSIADTLDTAVCQTLAYFDHAISNATSDTLLKLQTRDGCDSTLLLSLHINSNSSNDTIAECDKIVWRGKSYISNSIVVDTLVNMHGCDSLVITHIVVNHKTTIVEKLHGCDSLMWRDSIWYYTNATATDTIRHPDKCDSIYLLTLILDSTKHSEFSITANQIVVWYDKQYDTTGSYTTTIPIANGCDSVVTMHLLYSDLPTPQIFSHDGVIIMVNHYPWGEGGKRIDYPAYRWYRNGDSIAFATKDRYHNSYQPLDGCYYLMVAVDDSCSGWLKSNLECFENGHPEKVEQNKAMPPQIYPNPIMHGSKLQIAGVDMPMQTILYNSLGQVVGNGDSATTMPQMPGEYLLHIITQQYQSIHRIIVK